MKYEELVILLPCHSLEDFPLHHEGDDAQSLLASWTAMWHPALIASAGKIPTWHRVDDPPEDLSNRLLVVPTVSLSELQTGFAQRAKGEGANLIRKKLSRDEIMSDALEQLDGGAGNVSDDLSADFLALGYCFLQVELLTRQMRYASNLDEVFFNSQTVAAAQAAMAGNEDEAREKIRTCFDVLAEERDHYYPVDAFLIDLTLVAQTTIGEALRKELLSGVPMNVLLAAEVLATMRDNEPASLEALKAALDSGKVGLIGGEVVERRLPLFSNESILAELRRGAAEYESHLARRPLVYGRRRFGLTPALPQILSKLGFSGALHATLDDGRFPEGMQIKTRWEGSDGASIDALARPPLDATKPESYLNLAVKMGESMDMDHVATVCFAHWPGQSSPWYDDLRRIASYSSALGKFVTVDEYFRETDDTGQLDRFTADQYKSPYLKQAVIRRHEDPISTSVRYWQKRTAADAAQTLATLSSLVTGDVNAQPGTGLQSQVDTCADDADVESLDEEISRAVERATKQFGDSLPRKDGAAASSGYLVANPCSFVRRIGVEVPDLDSLPALEKPIYAAAATRGAKPIVTKPKRTRQPVERWTTKYHDTDTKQVVVDVPPMGFAWVGSGGGRSAKQAKPLKSLVEDRLGSDGILVLYNDFFEVLIDGATGALRSVHEYSSRGNRISQKLGLRMPGKPADTGDRWTDPDAAALYSVMVADSFEVTSATHVLGEIIAKGRLVDQKGETLAGFEQKYQLWRGSRVLRLEIELSPKEELRADPWNSYYASRFAWADESAELWRTVHQSRHEIKSKRIESPHYIDIKTEKTRTTVLTAGLPYHRLNGMRMLDSLLIVKGERARKFQLGIGIDLKHPMHESHRHAHAANRRRSNRCAPLAHRIKLANPLGQPERDRHFLGTAGRGRQRCRLSRPPAGNQRPPFQSRHQQFPPRRERPPSRLSGRVDRRLQDRRWQSTIRTCRPPVG